jgi:hypothetical protein
VQNLIFFLIGYAASMSGNWLRIATVGWIIKEGLGLGSEWYACYAGVCAILSTLLSPIASSIIRKGSRKLTLAVGNFLLCINALLFAAMYYFDQLGFPLLLLLGLFSNFCHTFTNIAEDVFLKEVTKIKHLHTVNHIRDILTWATRIVFATSAGFILLRYGPAILFVVDSITFAIMFFCITLVKLDPKIDFSTRILKKQFSFFGMFKFAYQDYITRFACTLRLIVDTFAFITWYLLPTIILDELGGSSYDYGMIIGLSGVGGIISLALTWYFRPKKELGTVLFVLFFFLIPIGLMIVGIAPILFEKKWAIWFMALGYGLAIFSSCPSFLACRLYLQSSKEPEYGIGAFLQCNAISYVLIWGITSISANFEIKSSELVVLSCFFALILLAMRFLINIKGTKEIFNKLFWSEHIDEV